MAQMAQKNKKKGKEQTRLAYIVRSTEHNIEWMAGVRNQCPGGDMQELGLLGQIEKQIMRMTLANLSNLD